MEKENYNSMNIIWIIMILSSCGIFKSNFQKEYIENYEVSSPILEKIVETTVDSCTHVVRCNKVEYLYIQVDTTSKLMVQVESIRKPLYKLQGNNNQENSEVISFLIGETLCFSDKQLLSYSTILKDFNKLDQMNLHSLSFDYSCLDIEFKGETYNTLITFRYIVNKNDILLEDQSIFIDSGDVDISEALEKRGIIEE